MAQVSKSPQRTRLDKQGRIVIPADIREHLGMQPGDLISFWKEPDGRVSIMTFHQAIQRVQEMVREKTGGKTGMVDEFIAERRREAERE